MPVEPDEYSQNAGSSAWVPTVAKESLSFASSSDSSLWPNALLPDTTTHSRSGMRPTMSFTTG